MLPNSRISGKISKMATTPLLKIAGLRFLRLPALRTTLRWVSFSPKKKPASEGKNRMSIKSRSLIAASIMAAVAGVLFVGHSVIGQDKTKESTEATASRDAPAELWTVRCAENEEGEKMEGRGGCEVFQRLVAAEGGQRVAEFAIGFPEDKEAARGVIILPLGILLHTGGDVATTQMMIDDGEPFSFRPRYCDLGGCYAYLNLNAAVLDMLRKGKQISFLFLDRQGKTIRVNMSLDGISKALKKIG